MLRFDLGKGYILLAATGVAVGNVAMKRLSGKVDAAMATAFQFLFGAVPLALISVLTEDVSAMVWSGEFLALAAALALLGTALAYWLWFATLERISLNRANAFAFLTPLIGLGIGAVHFAEHLIWIQFFGVGAVLVG
jgi:drug/metabolite transporter (DMT)-like permease